MNELAVEPTPIPGLLVVRLPVHEDARGWFKEAWQRQKMIDLGLPDFGPVQANVSFNNARGATRGLHAEPWDKLVSLATGRAFGAWVDLREGETFGTVFSTELDPAVAVFVPRGVANSYQTLTDGVAYSYLVSAHWRPGVPYKAVALDDPTCAIRWPVPLAEAEISDKDRANPRLGSVEPVRSRRPLILGANGQVGRALQQVFPNATPIGREDLDIADAEQLLAWPWEEHDIVLNTAAFTAVDEAEHIDHRAACWATNASGPALLAHLSRVHHFRLVHFSSDYVFDGRSPENSETDQVAPLSVYGQSKAAGDNAVLLGGERALVLRTSWVIGDGRNFVRTMIDLARRGVEPAVVDDQVGRLSFASDVASATRFLLESGQTGLFNVTNSGEPTSWADLAAQVFAMSGAEPESVRAVSTAEFAGDRQMAPRPSNSVMDLRKVTDAGWTPPLQLQRLEEYVTGLVAPP